jgi:serine/threonine-protein kinase RsbW
VRKAAIGVESPILPVSQSTDSLLLDGKLSELPRLAAETARFCREHALGDEVEFHLNLVLEELFANAIRHGGCEGMRDAARVQLEMLASGVAIEFADRGAPFDPTAAPAPDLHAPLETRQIGGLGIHLVRQIVRDLRYERVDGWNRLTMRRPSEEEES